MLSDDDLIDGFEAGLLSELPHADHVRVTLIYLTRYGRDEALRRVGDGLLLFATLKGHPEKFHVTLTRGWLDLVESARQACPPGATPGDVVAACPELLDKSALHRFYTPERLDADDARVGWVPPDRAETITIESLRANTAPDRTSRLESV